MSSQRFPGKMLAELRGLPVILQVCRRVAACEDVDGLIVATSRQPDDDLLAKVVNEAGYAVSRGSIDDVLDRVVSAAAQLGATTIVRVTGDCPLIDPSVMSQMLRRFEELACDYLCNVSPRSFPNGLDIEIVRADVLREAAAEATSPHDREHVTPFIRQRPERFRLANFSFEGADASEHHWSVDEPEDLAVVDSLLVACGTPEPRLDDLLVAVMRDPDLAARSRRARAAQGAVRTFRDALEAHTPWPSAERSRRLLASGERLSAPEVEGRVLVRTSGALVWDADGNEFVSYASPLAAGTCDEQFGVSLRHAVDRLVREYRLDTVIELGGALHETTIAFARGATWSPSELERLFRQEMVRNGILMGEGFLCSPHHGNSELRKTLCACRAAFGVLKFAVDESAIRALLRERG